MAVREAITETLLKFRYHALAAVAVVISAVGIVRVAPNFLTVLYFFSPLLASTALFLVAAVVINRTYSPGADNGTSGGSGAGEASSSSSSSSGGFDEKGYFTNTEGERGLLESVAQQQQDGRLVLGSILN